MVQAQKRREQKELKAESTKVLEDFRLGKKYLSLKELKSHLDAVYLVASSWRVSWKVKKVGYNN